MLEANIVNQLFFALGIFRFDEEYITRVVLAADYISLALTIYIRIDFASFRFFLASRDRN